MDPGACLYLALAGIAAWRLCWPVLRCAAWLALVGWYLLASAWGRPYRR